MSVVENNAGGGGVDQGLGIIINNSSSSSSLHHPAFSPNSNVSPSSFSYTDLHHHRNNNNSHNHVGVDPSPPTPTPPPPPPPLPQTFHTILPILQQQQRLFVPASSSASAPTHQLKMSHQFQLHNNISHPNNMMEVHQKNHGGGAFNGNSGFVGHVVHLNSHHHQRSNSTTSSSSSATDFQRNTETTTTTTTQRDIRNLEQLLSKLNPMAQEFVPPSLTNHPSPSPGAVFYAANNFLMMHTHNTSTSTNNPSFDIAIAAANGNNNNNTTRKKNIFNQGKHKVNTRTSIAQREDIIRRTVYVSDIDQQVTEEQLAALFVNCGQVVDCRICGDPNSVLRFAFIEFTDEDGARASLSLAGTMLGYYPVRVLPSKTAIAPVNPTFLPRSEDEREMCSRTIYCTNIDKKISQADVKAFFESLCGTVYRLRLLGDYHHSTRIAFVEFIMAESAILALNCSGVVLGSSPIRVSPSKTPVRPRAPRPQMH